ncbi:MAG TPA: GlsB/YeaQ/YmgE family stress response membrane protein [Blastocatellia bacterium]|nr:GlsB/YeaQ/YmgE family stress response membrane protein [Blastocatellia bacterium]
MEHLIGQIIFGLIVGIIAKFLMPGRDPGGFIITALIGMAGAMIGTFVGRAFWGGAGYEAGWIAAIIGSLILLAVYRIFMGGRVASS